MTFITIIRNIFEYIDRHVQFATMKLQEFFTKHPVFTYEEYAGFFEAKESVLQVFGPTVKYDSKEGFLHTPSLLNAEEATILKHFRKIKNKRFREGILRQLKGIIELEKK